MSGADFGVVAAPYASPFARCAGAPAPNPCNPHPPDCPSRSSLTAMTSPACSSFLLTGFDDCSLIGLSIGQHPRVPAARRDQRRQALQCRLRVPGGALGRAALLCADGLTASPQRPPQLTGLPALRRSAAGCPFGQRRGGFRLFSGWEGASGGSDAREAQQDRICAIVVPRLCKRGWCFACASIRELVPGQRPPPAPFPVSPCLLCARRLS